MTNQLSLSKAALKSTTLLLAHFEARQADTLATIATLKRILAESGVTTNGVASNGHGAPLDGPTKAERIVKKAQARFARHAPQKPARPDRLSPAAWRARIVDILTHRGAPMAVRDIQRQVGKRSNDIFKHLTAAVKAGVISRAPGPKGFYVLGRHAGRQAPAKKPKTSGQALNVKAQRQRSLAVLNTFSTETPRPFDGLFGKIAKLVSHGYLRRTKDGYLRTAKVYEVTPS